MENILGIIGIAGWGIAVCFIVFLMFQSIYTTIQDIVEEYKEKKYTQKDQFQKKLVKLFRF
jgi:hypothetical protein